MEAAAAVGLADPVGHPRDDPIVGLTCSDPLVAVAAPCAALSRSLAFSGNRRPAKKHFVISLDSLIFTCQLQSSYITYLV